MHMHKNITGNIKEICWFFVPGFQVKAPDGTVEYQISMVSKAAKGGVLVAGGESLGTILHNGRIWVWESRASPKEAMRRH
jgi:hypothetical protein